MNRNSQVRSDQATIGTSIPERHQGRKNDTKLPRIAEKSLPSRHSSTEPRTDKYGAPDPLGINELIMHALRDVMEDEAIRRTHREEAQPGSEEEKLQQLRDQWMKECEDIMHPPPDGLPPWREVNHSIPLIDPNKQYKYRPARCPEVVREELMKKINKYTNALWWKAASVQQAAPLLCVAKKNGKLRTVVDCRQRNDNTVKDVTPLPDQDLIRMDVARAKYRTKIDLSDAYEQVRIVLEDIQKTGFSTPYGTFLSYVMQQGDCNAPATFQRLMTTIFRDYIGRFVHVYLDDIFVYSDSIQDHQKHLKLVFNTLREQKLYLSKSKCDIYSKRMDCLGHIIDDKGLHADADKMRRIREWPTPRSYHEVQRFLGLVNYIAPFMPNISAYTTPLSEMEHNERAFLWRPLHQRCFDMIKGMACKAPILKPIDTSVDEPIWLICDASVFGIGAVYGQGPEWQTCRPAGFLSRKFSPAQQSYLTYDREALAIIEGLRKWDDKLRGRKFTVVTDHQALKDFKTTEPMSPRRIRWIQFMDEFGFETLHVPGMDNKVADALSRYYEADNADDFHPIQDYVNADVQMDPDLEDLTNARIGELLAGRITRQNPGGLEPDERNRQRELRMRPEPRVTEADEMAAAAAREKEAREESGEMEPSRLADTRATGPSLRDLAERTGAFRKAIKEGYDQDKTFRKILDKPSAYPNYPVRQGIIFTRNREDEEVVCIPRAKLGKRTVTQTIIELAHTTLGHLGSQKTSEYVRRWYWWPGLGREIEKYCRTCPKCQTSKPRNSLISGLLHSLPIPRIPWMAIAMDFVGPFPRADGGYDYLWVIVCRLTSMVHLIPVKTTVTAEELAAIYIKEVVRLHGLPTSIVSDRDPKFTAKFWKELHRLLGSRLLMSTAFHPQTDGASERVIRSIGQILRALVKPDQTDWLDKIPMTEFALNSAVSASTGYAPFELNYGYLPRTMEGIHGDSKFA